MINEQDPGEEELRGHERGEHFDAGTPLDGHTNFDENMKMNSKSKRKALMSSSRNFELLQSHHVPHTTVAQANLEGLM